MPLCFCLVSAAAAPVPEEAEVVKPIPDMGGWKTTVQPFIIKHCHSCHGTEKQKGDLNLENYSGNILDQADAGIWQEILDKLNADEMPPPKEPRPPTEHLLKTIEWINGELYKAGQLARAQGPGVRIRRLTNQEYRNTVRDLVGHPFDPTLRFLDDTEVHGFDNIAENLGLSTLHMQQYVQAAERIVEKMLVVPEDPPARQHWLIEPILPNPTAPLIDNNGAWHDGLRGKNMSKVKTGKVKLPKAPLRNVDPGPPGITGLVRGNIEIPNGFQPYRMVDLASGEPVTYEGFADIRAFGSKTGRPQPFKNRFGFRWFAHDEGRYRVTLHVDGFSKTDPPPSLKVMRYPDNEIMGEYEILAGVARKIRFNFYVDDVRHLFRTTGNRFWGMLLYFENGIHLERIEVEGPIHESWPPDWALAYQLDAEAKRDATPSASDVLRDFASRAWRRPLQADELDNLVALFEQERARKNRITEALRVPLISILSSPHFLCMVETRTEKPGPQKLDAHELANRLSYFLWRSMPDEVLRSAADNGSLLNEAVLLAQVDRMLTDPAISTFCETFPARWLGVEKVMSVDVDPRMYPQVGWGLRRDMLAETQRVFTEIVKRKTSCLELIDSDWTFLNSRLARHYGVPGPKEDHLQRVNLPKDAERGGLLTHGSILTLTSNGMRTLPITRGAFVLENILASPPPPPPPNVTPLEEVEPPRPNATTRELLEVHRKDPTCAACHRKIDPIGFALEGYDAVGRRRTHEHVLVKGAMVKTHPVDTAGSLPDGSRFDGLPDLKKIILDDADKFRRCLAEKMLVYALDREVNFTDKQLIDQLVQDMSAQEDSIQNLIRALVRSETFQSK